LIFLCGCDESIEQRLEEQMNDLIELHQHEIENLKQGIVDMEEKVQYQSEERLRDIYELLEVYQTRVRLSINRDLRSGHSS
jgi:2C-methyl-D-erythritol 2,4-cyclodiphosphate synthase